MRCYHGTSADHLESIMRDGLIGCGSEKLWSCSEESIYCYTKRSISECGYDDEEDSTHDSLMRITLDSASVALALAKNCRPIVVVFEAEEDELEVDTSCPKMEFASCFNGNVPVERIREIYIGQDFSLVKGFMIASYMRFDLFNTHRFSEQELAVGKALSKIDFCYYELFEDVNWEKCYDSSKRNC